MNEADVRFRYRLVREEGRWVAECLEAEAAGEGRTQADAVACLRASLEERLLRPDAVAPPPCPAAPAIELVLVIGT